MERGYTTRVGDYLVVSVLDGLDFYIAEVVESNPLRVKISEDGPLSSVHESQVIIWEKDTILLQEDDRTDGCIFLEREQKAGRKILSGLRSLGITDGKYHEMLPANSTVE